MFYLTSFLRLTLDYIKRAADNFYHSVVAPFMFDFFSIKTNPNSGPAAYPDRVNDISAHPT